MSHDYRYHKKWRYDAARGIKRYRDPARAIAHLNQLLEAGASKRAIADAAGVSPSAISNLTRGQQKNLRRDIEARILAVTPAAIFHRTGAEDFVPDIGAKRRIHALNAIGHNADTIASHMGPGIAAHIVRNIANNPGRWISRVHHERVVAAYDALWDQPGTCKRTAGQARRFGYPPPLAWDDETIDNPDATPELGEQTTVSRGRPVEDLIEDIEFLLEHDPLMTARHIADRFGLTVHAIHKALSPERGNRPDLLDQLNRNAEIAGHAGGRHNTAPHHQEGTAA